MSRRVTTYRCRATISERSLQWRSKNNPCGDELRCCRYRQRLFNGKCFEHATDHDRIVQRILDIPCRD